MPTTQNNANPFDVRPTNATTAVTPAPTTTNTTQSNSQPNSSPTASFAPVQPPSGGIIGAQLQQVSGPTVTSRDATASTYNASTATSRGYDPATMQGVNWNVDKNQTVAGQLDNVIGQGSPLLDKAQADARQAANNRGLINSSMAAGAGTAALLDRALQIATPDAATYAGAGRYNADVGNNVAARNQDAINRASEFGANAENNVSQFNAQSQNQAGQFNAQAQTNVSLANAQASNQAASQTAQLGFEAAKLNQNQAFQTAAMEYDAAFKSAMANADAANKVQLVQLDGQIKQGLMDVEARYKNQMQASQSAANMYAQTMQEIGKIMNNPDLDGPAKQNLINQLMSSLKNSLELQAGISTIEGLDQLIGNLDVGIVEGARGDTGGTGGGGGTPGDAPADNRTESQRAYDDGLSQIRSLPQGDPRISDLINDLQRRGVIGQDTAEQWRNEYATPAAPDPNDPNYRV